MSSDYIYDIEIYPNVFTLSIKEVDSVNRWQFEISHRRNDFDRLLQMVRWLQSTGARMVGFNNVSFDYPVLHLLLTTNPPVQQLYEFATKIINVDHGQRFDHIVWDRERLVEQVDLLKIHHFDNPAKMTSLKLLEFNMRLDNIADLPFPPGSILTDEQIDVLLVYNDHDIDATEAFYIESLPAIKFREQLSEKYDRNFINHNDTKIGKDYFIMELERKMPGSCYTQDESGRRKPRQTWRQEIVLRDVIFPWIRFRSPEFTGIQQWLAGQTIRETKGVFDKLSATVDGFQFDFGTGGIHGSVSSQMVASDDDHEIIDIDVTSFYPNLGIRNRVYPAHLSEQFCDIYEDVFDQRNKVYTKKAYPLENAMLKLALNGVYGDSNNVYSPFYDPQYTMAITINGQLLICLLADWLMPIPGLQIIQANTDGITICCPRSRRPDVKAVCDWWQSLTKLELEEAVYSRMWIRDVNNYLAEYDGSGKLKRKGAYEWVTVKNGGTLGWHQNHSALIIPMAAEAALVESIPVEDFIPNHDDLFDFMLRAKVPRTSRLLVGNRQVQNITRFFVSKRSDAGALVKVMPPLAKAPGKERRIGICVGWNVTECNRMAGVDGRDINLAYYISEAKKLVAPVQKRY